jgi:hypothetical protein
MIAISAIAGFLVAAFLVIIPGTVFFEFMRPGRRPVAQEFLTKERELLNRLHHKHYAPLDNLNTKFILLCLAQNELDCFPFLLICASVGPAIILSGNRMREISRADVPTEGRKITELSH